MKINLIRTLCIGIFLCFVIGMDAQSAGDKLFKQGQELQMQQTVKAQNLAIAKFAAAKKAYDSADKKTMCDNQIKICENNKKTLSKKHVVKKEVEVVEYNDKAEKEPITEAPKAEPVNLSLSVSSIEFKSSGKKSDNHQVTVNCNYDSWTYNCPDWVSVTKNGNVLTLTASVNDTGSERSAVFSVECKGVKAELMVYQKAKFSLKNLISGKKENKS